MLRPEYLSRKLTSPLPTKDGGTLRTIGEACEYMAAIGKEREQRLHWQRVREVMLQEADEAAVTWRVQLAVLKDAKLDVTALSEPIERMIGEPPPGLLSNAELNVMEEDEQPTELTESNERSDSDGREERRREEELQQAEAQRLAEEERRREEELQQAEARRLAEEERRREEDLQPAEAQGAPEQERRREEELQQAEARRLAEEERRREEAENRPFWRRFWPYSRP
jgi:hypothetical protein